MTRKNWRCCRNRHPNCDGTTWGWVEDETGHTICHWSNRHGSELTEETCERFVMGRNQQKGTGYYKG
jgi:hypothetical protein